MDKNFNEFFEELNDMANFKNFGESKEEEITNAELKAENGRLKKELDKYNVQPPACIVDTVYQGAIISNEIYKQTLQEIKTIANIRFVNGINQEADIYNAQMSKILDLITKAESEG